MEKMISIKELPTELRETFDNQLGISNFSM